MARMRPLAVIAAALLALASAGTPILPSDRLRQGYGGPPELHAKAEGGSHTFAQLSDPFFPVGVWYGGGKVRAPMVARDPAPERDAWRRDLQTIKGLGFNSVKAWIDWASAEPARGRYRFDALDQLLTLADEAGLRVIVQIYTDAAPDWLGRAYVDASFVTDQGAAIGSQASPGYCLDHAGVRADLARFIAAVSARARSHVSFYAFDVWSEPHLVNWVWFNAPVEFCYCPHTQARFREWLRAKYGTLERVNAAWYRTFEEWTQVSPPRYGTILSYTDFIDWKTFIADKLREDLRLKADAARGPSTLLGGMAIVTSHSDAPAVLLSPLSGFGNPDDWWMTRSVDHYGTSIYPRHASAAAPWSPVRLTSALDAVRSAARDQGWWMGELQAGQGATGVRVGTPVTAADLRFWGWSAISRGVRAISYYAWYPMSSGYESNGYGMIELDGAVTDRARAAGSFAGVVGRNAGLFAALRPRPSQVAILYNRLSYLVGGNTVGPGTTVRASMMGMYRALFERNIQADFIHPDEIVAGLVSNYRVVFLGSPLMLSRPVVEALKAYVRQGGTLVSEARPAWNDERGFANDRIPGAGLDEVFGAREARLEAAETVEMIVERDGPPALAPLSGAAVRGTLFAEHLEITSPKARVLARFAARTPEAGNAAPAPAAIVLSTYGSGQAILIGSFPAAAYDQDPAALETTGDLLRRLASLGGVEPAIAVSGPPPGLVEGRMLESPGAFVFIGLNHDTAPHEATFAFGRDVPIAEWQNLETAAVVQFAQRSAGSTYTHRFGPRDAVVLVIGKRRR
jgi:beta-galactosidase